MNRNILIAILLICCLTGEAVVVALMNTSYEICMMDSAMDGEAEKDSKEKSELDSKVKIQMKNEAILYSSRLNQIISYQNTLRSQSIRDIITPPPQSI